MVLLATILGSSGKKSAFKANWQKVLAGFKQTRNTDVVQKKSNDSSMTLSS